MVKHRETGKHHAAFETWYELGRNTLQTSAKIGSPRSTIQDWTEWFSWHARADKRDADAKAIADRDAVKRKAAALIRHRQAGELMQRRGIEFYTKNTIDRAPDATQAIKAGIEIERQAEGWPDYVMEIMNADEQQLRRTEAELDARRRAAAALGEEPVGDALAAPPGGEEEGEESDLPRVDGTG